MQSTEDSIPQYAQLFSNGNLNLVKGIEAQYTSIMKLWKRGKLAPVELNLGTLNILLLFISQANSYLRAGLRRPNCVRGSTSRKVHIGKRRSLFSAISWTDTHQLLKPGRPFCYRPSVLFAPPRSNNPLTRHTTRPQNASNAPSRYDISG